jgi:hypothetical protein
MDSYANLDNVAYPNGLEWIGAAILIAIIVIDMRRRVRRNRGE